MGKFRDAGSVDKSHYLVRRMGMKGAPGPSNLTGQVAIGTRDRSSPTIVRSAGAVDLVRPSIHRGSTGSQRTVAL